MELNELNKDAQGGTETMARGLEARLPTDLMSNFQVICSRVRTLDETKLRVLWLHDLPGDPESDHLANGGWQKFHKLVFVSNWQMQQYCAHYKIPWHVCEVIHNAIEPFDKDVIEKKLNDRPMWFEGGHKLNKINIIYHTTPHRGLTLLVPAVKELAKKHPEIHLDVYSSFKIYGWPDRDKDFASLFESIAGDPNMTYHGFKPNEEVRKGLENADIFAYPSTWPETSCISLMEGMSAGLVCVHPNLAALYETAANWTTQYQWLEDQSSHASRVYSILDITVQAIKDGTQPISILRGQKSYADLFYSWDYCVPIWQGLLESLVSSNAPRALPVVSTGPSFEYKV